MQLHPIPFCAFSCSRACKPGSVPLPGRRSSICASRCRERSGAAFPPPHATQGTLPVGRRSGRPDGLSHRTYGVASDRVYSRSMLPWKWVSSYLAFPSLPRRERRGGLFLLHFSGGCPRLTLSVILPCDARTFLALLPFGVTARDRPARLRLKYTMFCGICQGAGRIFAGGCRIIGQVSFCMIEK